MVPLNSSTVAQLDSSIKVPKYDRKNVRPGIVHFGVGNFFRVHQAVYVDDCLHMPGNEKWGIVGVGLTNGPGARDKAEAFRAQDCLYSVTEFATDGSANFRVIGAVIDYLHAPSDPEAVLVHLEHPETRIVTMTLRKAATTSTRPAAGSCWKPRTWRPTCAAAHLERCSAFSSRDCPGVARLGWRDSRSHLATTFEAAAILFERPS